MNIFERLRQGVLARKAADMESIATELATQLSDEAVLELNGDLGSGKTTFVKGLAKAWNIQEMVTSPTFNIFNVYEGARKLLHMDAYRLEPEDHIVEELMLEDFAVPPFCLAIEWPSHLAQLPWPTTHVLDFSIREDSSREIKLKE